MSTTLDGMTAARWSAMTEAQRAKVRDNSAIDGHALRNWQGWRVEVVDAEGNRRRFIVGRSTGWRPCLLEIARSNSRGGSPVAATYASVKPLHKRP